MLANFFQLGPIPANHITGNYSVRLVILSYLVATAASYVALDITNRMKDVSVSRRESYIWLLGGSLAMGTGIWSMHFIGMLAFILPMPMLYDPKLTALSIVVAIFASGIAFTLLRPKSIRRAALVLGGVVMGIAIAAMHYTGMAAMAISMEIHYLPTVFALSILIAIIASEAALYLIIKSMEVPAEKRFFLKLGSALIMGAAICGMHYTGMAAAVFTPLPKIHAMMTGENPDTLSVMVAMATIFILGIAIAISSFKEALSLKSVAMARQSGMAEVASSVLHNVGNVLNSVNVSSSLISDHLQKLDVHKLQDVNKLIAQHKDDLADFITRDPAGTRLPGYLVLLYEKWAQEYELVTEEHRRLESNIQHIKEIIALQQSFSGIMSFAELTPIDKLLDEAITLTGIDFNRHHIIVKKEYAKLKPTYVDKLKLTQIVINIIRNAKDALLETDKPEKFLIIRTGVVNDSCFCIKIIDNGSGILPSNKSKVFSYGFTTKKTGHGFGLHASILAIKEMKGNLKVESEGVDQGATFLITLPYKNF